MWLALFVIVSPFYEDLHVVDKIYGITFRCSLKNQESNSYTIPNRFKGLS